MALIWLVPISGLLTLGFVYYLAQDLLKQDKGTEKMQEVGDAIYRGAVAFITRQYSTIALLAIVTTVVLSVIVGSFDKGSETDIVGAALAWRTGLAFLVGAAASALSGIIGMYVAVQTNQRVASAARNGVEPALRVALNGGAVAGFVVVALSLLSVFVMFVLYGGLSDEGAAHAPFLIVGMGFGASFVALFAQLGGGIYTKAADVGADLVGKVEADIPEDDPRNAGVIADLVGDNVGDCAGRGADLFESTVAESIGAMILGVGIYAITDDKAWVFFPLVVRALGLLASILGIWVTTNVPQIKLREGESPMNPMYRGYALTAGLCMIALFVVVMVMLGEIWFFLAGLVGLLTSLAFVVITMYYTEHRFRPVKMIVNSSLRGSGPNIITGLAMGFENTALPAISVGIALVAAYWMGGEGIAKIDEFKNLESVPLLSTQIELSRDFVGGIYGTAVAAMGMLMTAAYVLAMDTFGPIVDNAGGIVEMSGVEEEVRKGTDALDAAGNTTKALTKGYAMGSAALAAFLLFSAYLDKVALIKEDLGEIPSLAVYEATDTGGTLIHSVNLADVNVFVGALLGAMLVFLFSSLAIRGVSQVAERVIEEVRRQFREIPGLLEGKEGVKAEYGKAVDITTQGALRAMILPGVVAVGTPIAVGVLLGAEAAAGFLMVGTIAGILLAIVMNNGGGAWDNAKKYIESGALIDANGVVQGKKSEAHKAAVVGDTVGDPFKDTAGPSLHVLIKLLATITLVLAPLFV